MVTLFIERPKTAVDPSPLYQLLMILIDWQQLVSTSKTLCVSVPDSFPPSAIKGKKGLAMY